MSARHHAIAAASMLFVSGAAQAITCASPMQVSFEHASTQSTIITSINAMSAAIVSALATQTTTLLAGLEAVNKSVQIGTEAMVNMIEAQTAETQRFTQDQTTSLLAGLSHSADYRYGEVQAGVGGAQVQITPHAVDACEQAAISAGVRAGRQPRINYEQTARNNGRLHAGGRRFTNARAAEAWSSQQPDEVYVTQPLTAQRGTMTQAEANRSSEVVLMLLDPEPPAGVSAAAAARAGSDPMVKVAQKAAERRSGAMSVATDALNRLASSRMPVVPLDATTRSLYPHWDWSGAVDPATGNTSDFEMLRFRATYDYGNPDLERELLQEHSKASIARLNRYMSVNNALQFERLAVEREMLLIAATQHANAVRDGDAEIKRLVVEADRVGITGATAP